MASDVFDVRRLLARADQHRTTAQAADSARCKIRLGQRPVQRRGLLRFMPKRPTDYVTEFTAAETTAIYRALWIVEQDERAAAVECERMAVEGGSRGE